MLPEGRRCKARLRNREPLFAFPAEVLHQWTASSVEPNYKTRVWVTLNSLPQAHPACAPAGPALCLQDAPQHRHLRRLALRQRGGASSQR